MRAAGGAVCQRSTGQMAIIIQRRGRHQGGVGSSEIMNDVQNDIDAAGMERVYKRFELARGCRRRPLPAAVKVCSCRVKRLDALAVRLRPTPMLMRSWLVPLFAAASSCHR